MLLFTLLTLRALAQDPPPPPEVPADDAPDQTSDQSAEEPPPAGPTRVQFAPTPPPEPTWIGTPQAMARYDRLRMRVVPTPATGGFVVRDGNGYSYDAWAFARATLDQATVDVLEGRSKRVRLESFLISGGGALVAALSVVPLAFIEPVKSPDQSDYNLDPNDFPSDDSYQTAQADATALYQLALLETQTVAGRNENRRWTALTLGAAGTLIMLAGPIHHDRRVSEALPVDTIYGRKRADELVEQYNAGLRARLEILAAPPPESTDPDSTDPDSTDPDSTDPAEVPAEVPASGGEPLDLPDAPPPPVQLVPFVGPGMIGLQGRF